MKKHLLIQHQPDVRELDHYTSDMNEINITNQCMIPEVI